MTAPAHTYINNAQTQVANRFNGEFEIFGRVLHNSERNFPTLFIHRLKII